METKKSGKIAVGVSAACGYPEPPEVFVKKLCQAGVKNIELFVNCDYEAKPDYAKEIKAILDGEGASCVSYHPFTCVMDTYAMFSSYERRTQEYLDYHKRYFESMNVLGAKYFVFHGAKVDYGDEVTFGRFARLNEIAEGFGVKVLQENVNQKVTGDLETLKRMKAYFGEKAGFTLDTKQARRMGWDPMDAVYALGDSIKHIHISDGGELGDCLLLGKGDMDIKGFVSRLKEVGFEGAILLELYRRNYSTVDELVESMKFLENIVKSI